MTATQSRPVTIARFATPWLTAAGLVVTAGLLIGSAAAVDTAETALDRTRRGGNQLDAELEAASVRAEAVRRATAHWQLLEALAHTPDPLKWSRSLQETLDQDSTETTLSGVISTSFSPQRPPAGNAASLLRRSEITARFILRHEGHLPRLLDAIESTPHVRVHACMLERMDTQHPARITAECRLSWLSVALPAADRTP